MKTIFYSAIISLLMVGCSKNNDLQVVDANATNPTKILSKWKHGGGVDVYYHFGSEVYRDTIPASNGVTDYYQFKENGVFTMNELDTKTGAYVETPGSYTFSEGNSVVSIGLKDTPAQPYQVTFPNDNVIVLSSTFTGDLSLTKNGVTIPADKMVSSLSLVKEQ